MRYVKEEGRRPGVGEEGDTWRGVGRKGRTGCGSGEGNGVYRKVGVWVEMKRAGKRMRVRGRRGGREQTRWERRGAEGGEEEGGVGGCGGET